MFFMQHLTSYDSLLSNSPKRDDKRIIKRCYWKTQELKRGGEKSLSLSLKAKIVSKFDPTKINSQLESRIHYNVKCNDHIEKGLDSGTANTDFRGVNDVRT